MKLSSTVYTIFFIALLVGIGWTVYTMTPASKESFTEFYLLGPGGQAQNYPTRLTLGQSGTVILVLVNHENRDAHYSITVNLDEDTIGTIDVALGNGQDWHYDYTFTPTKVGNQSRLDFTLYINGTSAPYRELHLLITVVP